MRRVKTRKPWRCDNCGREFPTGSAAYVGMMGKWMLVEGFGRVHVDGEFRICSSCRAEMERDHLDPGPEAA